MPGKFQSGPADYERGRRPLRTLSGTNVHAGGPKAGNGSIV